LAYMHFCHDASARAEGGEQDERDDGEAIHGRAL
jgi:hypothetical protein